MGTVALAAVIIALVGSETLVLPGGRTALASASTSSSANTLAQGVYVGAADPSGVKSFASATGTDPTIASDYLPGGEGWAGMDGAGGDLNWMFSGGWTGSGYTLSLGVPIIPDDSSGDPVGTLATGATGAYNSYFVTLAQNLVADGASNAYLRLGWEFDGNWFAWSAQSSALEADYATYFQQIVTAMRSVSGENFRFVWNPDAGAFTTSGYNVDLAYPGNAYVNVIALDEYDQTWVTPQTPANEWNDTALPALTAAQQFASAQGVPLAFAEWGLAIRSDGHGLGDDPLFVNNMVAWMQNPANNVAYESYFNIDESGESDAITDGNFPNSLTAFTADLGQSTATGTSGTNPPASTTTTTAAPAPTTTTTAPPPPTTTTTAPPPPPPTTTTTTAAPAAPAPTTTTTTTPARAAATSTKVAENVRMARYGSEGSTVFSVTVSPSVLGQANIMSGTTTVCTATILKGAGSCSPSNSVLSVGNHSLNARFVANSTASASVSSSITLMVRSNSRY
jgi:hypothetical protein